MILTGEFLNLKMKNGSASEDRGEWLEVTREEAACDIEQYEKGFRDGYVHGLEIAIIETENTIGRTKKAAKLCATLVGYKMFKAGEQE